MKNTPGTVVQQALIAFFEQAARKDRALLEKLEREPDFSVESERWCFTLPGLHAFLKSQDQTFGHVEYAQFRKMVFGSTLNQAVKSHGGEIIIHDNQGHVDKTGYALVWWPGDEPGHG